MLLLPRRAGQSICIGDQIEIKVVSVNNIGQTVIGIEAPRLLKIDRKEVKKGSRNTASEKMK